MYSVTILSKDIEMIGVFNQDSIEKLTIVCK